MQEGEGAGLGLSDTSLFYGMTTQSSCSFHQRLGSGHLPLVTNTWWQERLRRHPSSGQVRSQPTTSSGQGWTLLIFRTARHRPQHPGGGAHPHGTHMGWAESRSPKMPTPYSSESECVGRLGVPGRRPGAGTTRAYFLRVPRQEVQDPGVGRASFSCALSRACRRMGFPRCGLTWSPLSECCIWSTCLSLYLNLPFL